MSERCSKKIVIDSLWNRHRLCRRPAIRDGYCKQHHPDAEAARRKASDARFAEQRAIEDAKWEAKRIRDRKAELFDELVAALEIAEPHLYAGVALDEVNAVLVKAKEIGP